MSFEEFMHVPCWLDQWDEQLEGDQLRPETYYRTGYTKQFLFWIHSTEKFAFDYMSLMDTLRTWFNVKTGIVFYHEVITARKR